MTFVKVMGFSLFVLLSYTFIANIVPQFQSDAPVEEEIEVGSLDMAGMVSWGGRLFSGKGNCTLCHNNLGRAPDLLEMDLAIDLPARLQDARYQGEASDVEGYLRESMTDPSAFVVAGFGKKGSSDSVSPMPTINAPPTELSNTEIDALIAYLQDLGGFDPTVPLPTEGDAVDEGDEDEEEEVAATGLEAINKYSCGACHDLEGSEADMGPRLNGIADKMDRSGVRQAIIDPNEEITEGFEEDIMPDFFGEEMRAQELELIIDYLMSLPDQGK